MELVLTINQIFPLFTLIGQITIILLVISFFVFREKEKNVILSFFSKNAIILAFIVALVSTIVSLFYSEIVGWEPCKLCWFQRVFMYPQVILLGMALWKKKKNIKDYSIVLSLVGTLIAGFHYYLQVGDPPQIICSTLNNLSSCSKIFIMEFGYITFPIMSLTAFLLIISFLISQKIYLRNQ
ncbi:MAG TPA: disulfide bond formation protein B [Candidatus Parcubacteria bacterium]|jgi:disulfide bond formation protein DsbB|nr:disulfide bond formation protein B [Parcubacteria group bacterium]HJN62495.1 disulfide bond formation protein B [Candidatus Parcubacteria bacterium]|tara:strand:- start:13286 stop:13831 length:546 start_codon:yes stop_codon:yes gene_type:complete